MNILPITASAGSKKAKKHQGESSLLPNNQQCRVARLDPQGVHLNQQRLQVLFARDALCPMPHLDHAWCLIFCLTAL